MKIPDSYRYPQNFAKSVDSCWTMISCDTPFSRCDRQLLRNMHYKDVRQALTPLMCTCFLPETGELVQACYAELCSRFRKCSMHDRQCWWWIISEVWCSTVLRWPRNNMLRRIPASMFLLRRFLHLFLGYLLDLRVVQRAAHISCLHLQFEVPWSVDYSRPEPCMSPHKVCLVGLFYGSVSGNIHIDYSVFFRFWAISSNLGEFYTSFDAISGKLIRHFIYTSN